MPELPEVETIARTLAPQIEGARVRGITVLLPKTLQCSTQLLPRLENALIERVARRAKLLLLFARTADHPRAGNSPESELVLAFHLKMTGCFFVHPGGTAPLKHTRLIFDLETRDGAAGRLFFDDMRTFGFCRVMQPGDLDDWPFWRTLGPEPLDGPPEALAAHLATIFATRRGAVKAALLDQEIVAGIGNIYADESLFKAGIRPGARACDISGPRLLALAAALQEILLLSIRECGSSIRDYRDANGNAGAFQNSFAVYGRKDKACPSCGGLLEGTRIAGRGTVFCPRCQK